MLDLGQGLKTKIIEPPAALVLVEELESTGLPLWSGGLRDQPYFFMLERKICRQEKAEYSVMLEINRKAQAAQGVQGK